ncbi:MAG: tRNA pseudouridine(55) synthase TruB [Eubacterium sp.]|nr:tRNA pseudouridine(55) synthase TruB [Eubacterium sp.]
MNGMINVYKEKGYTSHDVVAKLRGICHQKKIGHTGTLDPDAEGVLPVCLGTATKVCELLTDKDKVYEAVLLLGWETSTQDISGTVYLDTPVSCTEEEVRQAVASFAGGYCQIPPMYSALKVNGKKLCDLAREGVEVARSPRYVNLYEIDVLWIRLPRVKLRVHCSKGTYIRTLCHDIGRKLGCGGCMEELLRTSAGSFSLDNAYRLSQIQKLAEEGRLEEILMPVDQLFLQYPKAEAVPKYGRLLLNGNRLPRQALAMQEDTGSYDDAQMFRVYLNGAFYALYQWDGAQGDYKPAKIFGQTAQGQAPSKRGNGHEV